MTLINQVIRDPRIKDQDAFIVVFGGQLCQPTFNNKGAANIYLHMLERGSRTPEY